MRRYYRDMIGTRDKHEQDEYDSYDRRQSTSGQAVTRSRGSSDDVFDSGLTVLEDADVIVPKKVERVCLAIQEEVGRPEWGALFKGEWTENGFEVKPDYVVPEQKVSRAHIDYEEDLKKFRDEGYVVNVHSHPFSGRSASFSGTDDDHINSHFEVALLYGGKAEAIVDGIVNVDVSTGVKLQVGASVTTKRERGDLPDVDISNIERRGRTTGKGTSSRTYKYRGSSSSSTGSSQSSFQTGTYENYKQKSGTAIKLPESKVKGDVEDYDDVEGVEVVPDEELDWAENEE